MLQKLNYNPALVLIDVIIVTCLIYVFYSIYVTISQINYKFYEADCVCCSIILIILHKHCGSLIIVIITAFSAGTCNESAIQTRR